MDQLSNCIESKEEENLPERQVELEETLFLQILKPAESRLKCSSPHPSTPLFARTTLLYSSKPQDVPPLLGSLPGIPPKHELISPSVLHLLISTG